MSPLSLTAMTFATMLAGSTAAMAQATGAPPPPPGNPLGGQFTTEAEAKNRCPSDAVVWVNRDTKVYHLAMDRHYGKTKQGFYMCRQEASSLGFRPPSAPGKTAAATPAQPPAAPAPR